MTKLTSTNQVEITNCSSLYETSPVDYLQQPDFLNTVVELKTALKPAFLLNLLQETELSIGLPKDIPKGPRVIDLDILIYDNLIYQSSKLTLPHPAICDRKFVLIPLLEIAPKQYCTSHHRPFRKCLHALTDQSQQVELYHG